MSPSSEEVKTPRRTPKKAHKNKKKSGVAKKKPAAKTKKAAPPGVLIGEVTHYFPKVRAAAVRLKKGTLSLDDFILFEGKSNFKQRIQSLQIDRTPVSTAKAGAELGIEVTEPVFEGDQVYRLKE